MHCYQTLAATMKASEILATLPGGSRKLPLPTLADWLETQDIEIAEILAADPVQLKARLIALAESEFFQGVRPAA